jgi:FAD/FMN-containing dehydrogenase
LQNLSASIESMTLVDGSGQRRLCSKATLGDDFDALKVGLGAFGVVTEIEMNLRPAFKLREQSDSLSGTEVLSNLEALGASGERFEFFWQPRQDAALIKTLTETLEAPDYPVGSEGERCGWNFEVLPNHRPHLHTEMEYSVAAEDGPKCFAEIRDLLLHRFTEVQWPVEYRTLAKDDSWLSNAFGRETVTISVHEDVRNDERAYYQACETIFLKYQGRPHWGKVHYAQGADFLQNYPRWLDWWRVRDDFDPAGRFLNDFLASIRP